MKTEPQQPVSHAIGLPALRELQGTGSRLASGGYIIVARVSIEVTTKATNFILKPLSHSDAEGVEIIVSYLDVLWCFDDNETLGR